MEAVVFGASGFIGTRLVAHLARQGWTVTAVDRDPPRRLLDRVRYETLDVRFPVVLAAPPRADVVYNLAAVHRTPGHEPHEYYETNVAGALNVLKFSEDIGAKVLVFTSSISVYGPSEALLDETSPLAPTSDYGRSKSLAETIHRQWIAPGRRLVVVRPGVVFGPGEGGNYTSLARALSRRRFAYPGRRDTIKSGGYVDELIRSLDFAVQSGRPETTYNFAYPDPSSTQQIVKTFGRVAGFSTNYPTLPIGALLAVAWGFEGLAKLGYRTPIHRERVWKLVKSTRIAPRWLLDNGYVFGTDLESALSSWRSETDGRFE